MYVSPTGRPHRVKGSLDTPDGNRRVSFAGFWERKIAEPGRELTQERLDSVGINDHQVLMNWRP